MYKIKAIARGKVILGDLGLSMFKGDVIDLDERFPRSVTDASTNLNAALAHEHIAVLHKDVEKPMDANVLAAIEHRIRNSIMEEMRNHQQSSPSHASIEDKLNSLISLLGQQRQPTQIVTERPVHSTDNPIGDDKAIDIHTRAVKRLTKDAAGHVESSEKLKDSDAARRAKELEDLM